MHLHQQYKTYNGKRYEYYSIAESYWVNGTCKKKILARLGHLTKHQAQQVRNVLKIAKSVDAFVATSNDILFENHWRYLDIAFLGHIWDRWNLSEVFTYSKNKDIQTADMAKILTSYRCLDPGSYLSSVEWFKESMMLKTENKFNDSRIYRELTGIENKKEDIELHIYNTLRDEDEKSFKEVYYDISDSFFEGRKCKLAKPGLTKNNGFKSKKIVISLLVNSKGYPFSWDVLKGDTADVKTLQKKTNDCTKRFGISDITWVFDRGMVSEKNLEHIEKKRKQKYITALDRDQIKNVPGMDLEWFNSFNIKNAEKKIIELGFEKYDDSLYYKDMGDAKVKGKDYERRYIIGFNPDMFRNDRKNRRDDIRKGKKYLEEENKELSKARGDRREDATKRRIETNMKKLRAKSFLRYHLKPITVKTEKGKSVKSFKVIFDSENKEAIKKAKKLDGLFTFITNHFKSEETRDAVEIIRAYRDKNRVEEAFKKVKSFIKFQPINVRSPKHVGAHYTVSILSYLMDITITSKLREYKIEGISSVRKLYKTLKRCLIGEIKLKGIKTIKKIKTLKPIEKKILKIFGCEHLVEKRHLRVLGID